MSVMRISFFSQICSFFPYSLKSATEVIIFLWSKDHCSFVLCMVGLQDEKSGVFIFKNIAKIVKENYFDGLSSST